MRTLRPSSLPAMVTCSRWESDESTATKATKDGTAQHACLSKMLRGEIMPIEPEDRNMEIAYKACSKVVAFVAQHAPNAQIQSEVQLELDGVTGTADIVAVDEEAKTLVIMDYKSAETVKNYKPQLLWYAAAAMAKHSDVEFGCVILAMIYGDTGNIVADSTSPWMVENENSLNLMFAREPNRDVVASPWCEYCKHRGACETFCNQIVEAHKVYTEVAKIPHEAIPQMLVVATELSKRIKELQEHAKLLLSQGVELKDPSGSFEYILKDGTTQPVDFFAAYSYLSSLEDKGPVNELLSKISISKTAVEDILKKILTPKERKEKLKELLGEAVPTSKLTRVTRKVAGDAV